MCQQLHGSCSQVYFVNRTAPRPVPPVGGPGNKNVEQKSSPPRSLLFERYTQRSFRPLLQPPGWGSASAPNAFLNRFGSPIVRPEAVSELVAAHYPRPNNLFLRRAGPARVLDETPQNVARANHYGHAFSSRNVLDEGADFLVSDESLVWAGAVLREEDVSIGVELEPWVAREEQGT